MVNAHPTLRWKDLGRKSMGFDQRWMADHNLHFFLKGRGATFQALASLRHGQGGEVLLPAFHCPSVVEPVLRAGYQPRFYAINRDLTVNVPNVLAQISQRTAAIVIVNYLGFPADLEPFREIRHSSDFCIIEDWAHSFLRANPVRLAGSFGDLVVYTFNKLLPTYAGGGLLVNNPLVLGALRTLKPLGKREGLIAVKQLAEEVLENGEDVSMKSLILGLERVRVSLKTNPADAHLYLPNDGTSPIESPDYFFETKLPWFARMILEKSDLETVVAQRRRNYNILSRYLVETDQIKRVYPSLPEDVCPWAYPLLVEGRGRYDKVLRSMGVPVYTFGETLHPLVYESESRIREDAVYLSKTLLLLPIHQNLSEESVAVFAEKVNDFFSSHGVSGEDIGERAVRRTSAQVKSIGHF